MKFLSKFNTVRGAEEDKILIVFGDEKRGYAGKNRAECFAEGIHCCYNAKRAMIHDYDHVQTRKQLEEHDPALAKICFETMIGDLSLSAKEWDRVTLKIMIRGKPPLWKGPSRSRKQALNFLANTGKTAGNART